VRTYGRVTVSEYLFRLPHWQRAAASINQGQAFVLVQCAQDRPRVFIFADELDRATERPLLGRFEYLLQKFVLDDHLNTHPKFGNALLACASDCQAIADLCLWAPAGAATTRRGRRAADATRSASVERRWPRPATPAEP